MERQLAATVRWIKIDPPVGWHSSAMHTGKRGVGGAWVFLTHIMYIWKLRQKIRQTQAQTHIHTLTGRSFHTTVTHPLILLTLTDLRTHHAGINMQPQSHMQTHTHWSF